MPGTAGISRKMVGLLYSKVLDINRLIFKIPTIFLLDKSMPKGIEDKLRHIDGATLDTIYVG
jgi:hypothetical protein